MEKFTEAEFDKAFEECLPKGYVDVPGYFNDGKLVVFYSPELWEETWNETLKQIL
jgi:hypothetical protein